MLKLIAPVVKKRVSVQNLENSNSETENVLPNSTSTPIKTRATTSKTTQMNSRNIVTGVLIDSTNQPTKQTETTFTKRRLQRTSYNFKARVCTTTAMPKAVTASLPVFDTKSGTFKIFEAFFRNNIKKYPHLTEI